MGIEIIVAGALALLLLGYLFYAMFFPENF